MVTGMMCDTITNVKQIKKILVRGRLRKSVYRLYLLKTNESFIREQKNRECNTNFELIHRITIGPTKECAK
jgi:hypothetical protein